VIGKFAVSSLSKDLNEAIFSQFHALANGWKGGGWNGAVNPRISWILKLLFVCMCVCALEVKGILRDMR